MSKPKYRWWGYAINVVEDYRRLVESSELLSCEYRERDALLMAIEATGQLPEGEKRLALLRFVYWDGVKRTIKEAADHTGVSERTAKKWHGDFLRLVGKGLGFVVPDESRKPGEDGAETP